MVCYHVIFGKFLLMVFFCGMLIDVLYARGQMVLLKC